MSQEIINKSLQKNLLSPLTHDKLWSQFLTACSYEISNVRDYYSLIKNTWNIEKNDKDNLIRISESFGYNPNLILNNTISMAKKEIESMSYRIQKKTTYEGYFLIFKQNELLGDVFNYYHNGYKLVKAIDYESTIQYLNESDHYSPFTNVTPIKNFSTTIDTDVMMLDLYDDNGDIIFRLDQKNNPWKLDTSYIRIPTNHLGIEYYPTNYYSSYTTSLGVGETDTHTYEMVLQIKNYLKESMKIRINDLEFPITITSNENMEYFQDDDGILDGSDSYYDLANGIIHLNFNEIPIDSEISVSYDVNLLMTPDYFYYLEYGAEYNRECPIIPHAGIFLTAEIASSRGSDFYYPNENHYTVPDLKMKAITASALNRYITLSTLSRLDNATDEEGQPTGEENYKLDSSIKWFLDSSSSQTIPLMDNIRYISCGNKALNVTDEDHSQIFSQSKMIFYYNLNTDDNSYLILDVSSNMINCTVVGDIEKVDGIIDKSLNFNGNTYAYSTSSLSMEPSIDYTLGIWFNAKNNPSDVSVGTIFDSFIKISYDYDNEKLIIDDTHEFDCAKDTDCFLVMMINNTNNEISVYMNCEFIGSFSYTILSTSLPIYIGTDSNETSNFYGIIDSLWLLSKIMTVSDMNYIYENKISIISHIGNRIAYYELYDDEKRENEDYMIIQSYVKGMDITNEETNISNDGSEYCDYQTKFHPIVPSYFTMEYTNNLGNPVTLISNEKGEFYNKSTNELVTGGINFTNGTWSLAKSTIKSRSQQKIDSPKRTDYPNAYHVIDELHDTDKWYSVYSPITDQFDGEFTADKIVVDDATDYSTLFIYLDYNNDSSPYVPIYSNDNEVYYVKVNSAEKPLGEFIVNNDNEEKHLFSIDNGKTLYLNLTDLTDSTHPLEAFVDLGESTNTTLYSTDEGTTMYLNVGCSQNKLVKKYKKDGTNEYGYVLDGGNVIYDSLSFNYISSPTLTGWTQTTFTPMQLIIKCTQVNMELTLTESRYIYENIYTIDYIKETHVTIGQFLELVPNSITFNYWINENGIPVKYTAVVSESGGVSGENILTGNFDYSTNVLTVIYREKLESDIVASYSYYHSLDLNYTKPIKMNYKVEDSMSINEIGLEDENHELVAYMTFPDIKFNDIYNNVSAMFAIAKN